MFTVAALGAAHVPEILAAEGGPWWRRDAPYWMKCLEEQRRGHRTAVIAADESGVIGYAYLNWRSQYPRFRTRKIPEISDLRVADRHRRLGVATAMIAHLERVARQAGSAAIGIGVGMYGGYGPAQRLYAKLGFMPDGYGLTYGNTDVEPGALVTVDDSLLLWLVRDLAPPAAGREGRPE